MAAVVSTPLRPSNVSELEKGSAEDEMAGSVEIVVDGGVGSVKSLHRALLF